MYEGSIENALRAAFGSPKTANAADFQEYSLIDVNNKREAFQELTSRLQIQEKDDWYKVTRAAIKKVGGAALLEHYSQSLFHMLKALALEHEWLEWKFAHTNRGYWNSMDNQRKYLDWLGKQLGVSELSDWYDVTTRDVIATSGACSPLW
jgi:hypothetical protein